MITAIEKHIKTNNTKSLEKLLPHVTNTKQLNDIKNNIIVQKVENDDEIDKLAIVRNTNLNGFIMNVAILIFLIIYTFLLTDHLAMNPFVFAIIFAYNCMRCMQKSMVIENGDDQIEKLQGVNQKLSDIEKTIT